MRMLDFSEIFELTDTTTSSSNLDEVQGSVWEEKVIHYGEQYRKFDQACIINTRMVNSGDKTVVFPKTTSHLDIDTAKSAGEAGLRDTTELSDLDTVSATIAASDFKQGAITISKEIAKTSRVDLVALARYKIGEALVQDVDTAIATALQSTTVTNTVYGGDATAVTDLAAEDVFNIDLIADAKAQIRDAKFKPGMLFLGPTHLKYLEKTGDIMKANEYGDQRPTLKGEIGEYDGLKIIETENAPAYASSATDTNEAASWAVAGKVGIMVGTQKNGEKCAAGLAWKEKPAIDYEYDKKRNKHWIYYDQCFKTVCIQPGAISLIKTAN